MPTWAGVILPRTNSTSRPGKARTARPCGLYTKGVSCCYSTTRTGFCCGAATARAAWYIATALYANISSAHTSTHRTSEHASSGDSYNGIIDDLKEEKMKGTSSGAITLAGARSTGRGYRVRTAGTETRLRPYGASHIHAYSLQPRAYSLQPTVGGRGSPEGKGIRR